MAVVLIKSIEALLERDVIGISILRGRVSSKSITKTALQE
jgi:hypothetical protein